jgi:transcriptional regulator with XRE-family HTH domain
MRGRAGNALTAAFRDRFTRYADERLHAPHPIRSVIRDGPASALALRGNAYLSRGSKPALQACRNMTIELPPRDPYWYRVRCEIDRRIGPGPLGTTPRCRRVFPSADWVTMMSRTSIDPIDRHVGARIRMRRLMLDNSQSDLADALGLSFQQVQKYEKGTNRVSASRLQQIAGFLQVPVPFFFEDVPTASCRPTHGTQLLSPAYVTDMLASKDGLALIAAMTQIQDRKLRRRIVELVEQIAEQFNQ